MANKIKLKNSSVAAKVPLTTDLDYGELALNYTDGKLYFKNASNVIKSFTIDDAVVTLSGTQTLTNKTISAGSNNISGLTNSNLSGTAGITNANLANSSITVGTTAIALGASSTTLAGLTSVTSTTFVGALTGNASTATTLQTARTINGVSFNGSANITVTATATNALTIGTGLSGTSYNGSGAVTIAIDSTVATLTGTQSLSNKTITASSFSGTTGAFSGQVTSTVATGTAPLVVASTTKVANLNVEMVDGYHADTANGVNTIAVRDASGEVNATGFAATGGMFEHANVISANYAINSGNNAISAGPVTVANGVTVTIPTGSTWVIV